MTAAELRSVVVVAHRGASSEAPENTLPSFELAWKQGADAIELDVHLTKDGQVVVIHDEDTARVAGGTKLLVRDSTLAALQALDVGAWKGEQYRGTRIPTLAQVLAQVPSTGRVLIEIKCRGDIVRRLEDELHRAPLRPEQVVVISFDFQTVAAFKARNRAVECLWLHASRQDAGGRWRPSVFELVRRVRAAGLDGLDVKALPCVDRVYQRVVARSGLRLYVWTVDELDQARRLATLGVDGVATNRPAAVRAALGQDAGARRPR